MARLGTALALATALAVVPGYARADPPSADNVKAAAQHFQKARDMYQAGQYKEAVSELEVALALDPTAKDLVYNLGVLSEKLGRIDDAIRYFKRYVEMDVDSSELAKGEAFIKRLRGARKELSSQHGDDDDTVPDHPRPKVLDKPVPAPKSSGTVTAILVTGTVLTVIGVGVGTVFGIKALADKPADGAVTSPSYTYNAFHDAAQTSHTEATIADIALGAGIGVGLVTLFLYVGTRPRAPIYLARTAPKPRLSLMPMFGRSSTGFALSGSF
jgi:tetratricopeptide (TPR) repeat protein